MNFLPVTIKDRDGIHFLIAINPLNARAQAMLTMNSSNEYYVAHIALAEGGFVTVPLNDVKNMPFQIGEQKRPSGIITPGQSLPGGFQ